jgi:diguanylate cyclase (GGDEF)-like protein
MNSRTTHPATALLAMECDSPRAQRMAAALEEAWLVDLGVALVPGLVEGCSRLEAGDAGCVIVGAGIVAEHGAAALEAIRHADADVPVVVLVPPDADRAAIGAIAAASEEQLPEAELSGVSIGRAIRYAIERKDNALQLTYEALHDALTGLPNRRHLVGRLETVLAPGGPLTQSGLCLLDVDDFALMTDKVGSDAGDELLFEIGTRLQRALRGADLVARYGGDEFAVLVTASEHDDPTAMARRAVEVIRSEPFEVGAHRLTVEARAGVAVSAGVRDPGMLLRKAEAALASAKRNRTDVVLYTAEMRAGPLRRLQLRAELESALEGDEFRLCYQPQVRLSDRRVVGLEALLRWQHPLRGSVLPGQFIPLAEDTGLIVAIGRHVLAKACADVRRWQLTDAGGPAVTVSVNLSMKQLGDPGLVEMVSRTVTEAGVDPAHLCLEVTETVAMERPEATAGVLAELKRIGVRLALDDFGTGHSSLSYLGRLPIDVLKIDRAFITGIDGDPRKRRIVGAVSGLAEGLEMGWLAEGVETAGELAQLETLGCDLVQGYYFGAPVPLEDLVRTDDAGALGLVTAHPLPRLSDAPAGAGAARRP